MKSSTLQAIKTTQIRIQLCNLNILYCAEKIFHCVSKSQLIRFPFWYGALYDFSIYFSLRKNLKYLIINYFSSTQQGLRLKKNQGYWQLMKKLLLWVYLLRTPELDKIHPL